VPRNAENCSENHSEIGERLPSCAQGAHLRALRTLMPVQGGRPVYMKKAGAHSAPALFNAP